jgi:hypothetical protein
MVNGRPAAYSGRTTMQVTWRSDRCLPLGERLRLGGLQARMSPEQLMIVFFFEVEGAGSLQFRLHEPVLADKMTAWACRVEWTGFERGDRPIYGASSLQSAELALMFVRSQLGAFEPRKITQSGAPFI